MQNHTVHARRKIIPNWTDNMLNTRTIGLIGFWLVLYIYFENSEMKKRKNLHFRGQLIYEALR